MRVGVNTLFYLPGEVGGSETYLRQTLGAIARSRLEAELVIFTNLENEATLRKDLDSFDQVSFRRLDLKARSRIRRILREQAELPALGRRSGIDLLWSPGYTTPLFCSFPLVTSVLDMQYRSHPEDLTLPARVATDVLVRAACRRSAAVIAISDFSRREILRLTSAPAGKVHVTHLAADPAFGRPLSAQERGERLRALTGGEGPYLLVVSNTYPHKSVETAVSAFGRLAGELPHRLIHVGQPRLGEKKVSSAVAALADPSRLLRLHRVESTEDLAALYQGADAFLFPSLYEGFGLPPLEALAAGAPVIAAGAEAVREVSGSGIVFFDGGSTEDLAGKILQVLSLSAGDRERVVGEGRKIAGRFTWEATAAATVEVFRKVLAP